MDSAIRIDRRLHDLVSDTFRLGLSLAAASERIYPLVAIIEAGIMEHKVFVDQQGRNHAALAEAYIAALPPHVSMYAYLRPDTAPVGGRQSEVLVVEAEARGMEQSVRFVQPYAPKRFLRPFRALSQPYQAGLGRRRLKPVE